MTTSFKRVAKRTSTVIDDYVFFDTTIGYKELGLHNQLTMLAKLQEQGKWDFSVSGLTKLHDDGKDSIRSGLRKLEEHGYLIRAKRRDESNLYTKGDQQWVVFDEPDIADWEHEASALQAAGFQIISDLMKGAKLPEMAAEMEKPQVSPIGGFSANGKSASGKADNGTQAAKPQVSPIGGFSANGKSATNKAYKESIDIQPTNYSLSGFSGAGVEGGAPVGRMDGWSEGSGFGARAEALEPAQDLVELMGTPEFKEKVSQIKGLAINRNRIAEADRALAALLVQGYDADEIIAEYSREVSEREKNGVERRYQLQLTGWLERDAADILDAKHAKMAAEADRKLAAAAPEPGGFDAAAYKAGMGDGTSDPEASMKVAYLRMTDPAFDALAGKVDAGKATACEVAAYERAVENAPTVDLAMLFQAHASSF